MAIKGSLQEASLPDVLQLLSLGRKTGCLSITDRSNLGYIFFVEGRVSFATVVNRRDRIGDILVKGNVITQEQLDAAIQRQVDQRETKVGEILVEMGALDRSQLEHYMRMQIEDAVYFLFTWKQGHFTFEADLRPSRQDFLVSIDPESLLLEGARRVDEWSQIEKKIPSFDLLFELDKDHLAASDVSLSEEQLRIVPLLDGSRDVTTIMEDAGLLEFDVGKALYGLITAGFVRQVGRRESREERQPDSARVEEHRNLGVAFYRTGMLDESKREFRRVVELKPSDSRAYFHLGLISFKQARWDQAADYFGRSAERGGARPAVLYNLALSLEHAGKIDEAESTYAEAAARARHDPVILMGWGYVALRRGDFEVAAGRLARAAEVAGDQELPALWYWMRSLAASSQGDLQEAEKVLREGLELYPDNTVLRNNLGALLELLGHLEEAQQLLERALADEPSLPQLSKNLGDLFYRAGRYDEAWDAYQRVVKLEPQLGDDVYFKLGNIAYKRLDQDRAMEYWTKALAVNPQHELARTNLETVSALK
ncbi:MAG: DUF4388 domain-containing protein [Gemmatimonadales bacterium]